MGKPGMKLVLLPILLAFVWTAVPSAFGESAGKRPQPVPPSINLPGDRPQNRTGPGMGDSAPGDPPDEVIQNLEVLKDLEFFRDFDLITQSSLPSEKGGKGCSEQSQTKGGCPEKPE
jgi:hypothetical protein